MESIWESVPPLMKELSNHKNVSIETTIKDPTQKKKKPSEFSPKYTSWAENTKTRQDLQKDKIQK